MNLDNNTKKRSLSDYSIISLKGAAMGVVELVPGISGGTIAFITGIYEEMLNTIKGGLPALKQLFGKKTFKQRISDFWTAVNGNFIFALGFGIVLAAWATANAVEYAMTHYNILFYAFIFGLIVASIVFVYKKISKWTLACFALGIIGFGLAFPLPIQEHSILPSVQEITTQSSISGWYFFICAFIASLAFIVPGTSGTFVMVLMGAYGTWTTAIAEGNLFYIGIFCVGCLTGLITFSTPISWLLKKYHDKTLALLTGFIVGSLRLIWPWQEKISGKTENILPNEVIVEAIVSCIIGIALVLGIEFIAKRLTKKHS